MPDNPGTTTKTNGSFQKDSLRHSPPPLAPLHYLQNHRRGSITDPSLHAAPMNTIKLNMNYRQPPDQLGSASSTTSAHNDSSSKSHPRPSSPYIFGDATPHVSDNSPQIRNLLRSPSIEQNDGRSPPTLSHEASQSSQSSTSKDGEGFNKSSDVNHMIQDTDKHPPGRRLHEPQFDYNMRRHSIAVGHEHPHIFHGTKRKMSADRNGFGSLGEEIDPQLAGPGVPSGMDVDVEAPAPKRRGSAIDTQRIAQLSLNDRRNSVDSRGIQFWINDRRGSTSSIFSNMGGYNSAFAGGAGDSPHAGRVPPPITTFAWPHSPDQSGPAPMQAEAEGAIPRSFDPAQMSMMPPMNFGPDRRMSVPDTLTTSHSPNRSLRSRSRPPSRQMSHAESNAHSGPSSSGPDDPVSAPSPTGSGKHSKESGVTPYSRSPELRVSHKLAERKRRKEMKDLFDELRDQLPADRGMKASKWEILSKAIDFVAQLKQSQQDMMRELDMTRLELEKARQGILGPPPHGAIYTQGPVPVPGQFPPPTGVMQQQMQQPHPQTQPPQPQPSISRPGSSQNTFTPGGSISTTTHLSQNGSTNRTELPSM